MDNNLKKFFGLFTKEEIIKSLDGHILFTYSLSKLVMNMKKKKRRRIKKKISKTLCRFRP